MQMDSTALDKACSIRRRQFLRGLGGTTLATLTSGCAGLDLPLPASPARGGGNLTTAVLLPLSGSKEALGKALRDAVMLGGPLPANVTIIDSGSDAERASVAAVHAVADGAQMIAGPVFGEQARVIGGVLPRRIPIVTLSNDSTLASRNRHVFGVTPRQSAQAALAVAKQEGLSDIVAVVPPNDIGRRSAEAMAAAAKDLGLSARPTIEATEPAGLGSRIAEGGGRPDAVYLPVVDRTLPTFAAAMTQQGIQVIGSTQWSRIDFAARSSLDGAWFAAPDPLRFQPFREVYAQETGREAGIITGLAYDLSEMLRLLGARDERNPAGLERNEGFSGVLGPYRLFPNGISRRGLAVLRVEGSTTTLIGDASL